MTYDVKGYFLVPADQDWVINTQTGFYLHQVEGGDTPWLDIAGTVTVSKTFTTVWGVDTEEGTPFSKVTIEAGGALNLVSPDGAAVGVIARGPMNFVNDGELNIQGLNDHATFYALITFARDVDITNNGSIHVTGTGGDTEAFALNGPRASVTNTGEILSQGGYAIAFFTGDHLKLANSGQIHAAGISGTAQSGDGVAIEYGGSKGLIQNSGLIEASTAQAGAAAWAIDVYRDGDLTIENSGTISAKYVLHESNDAVSDVTIHNTGLLDGAVLAGRGREQIVSSGDINGLVHLGGGDDQLTLQGKGQARGEVSGGGGDDSLTGAHADDTLSGDKGADLIQGRWGADVLSGGLGDDRFVYGAVEESDAAHTDLITDLQNRDRIDLSAIDADTGSAGDQAFVLANAFTGHAGELVLSYDAGSDLTTISGDVDGDGLADLVIHASGDRSGFTGLVL